MVAADGAPVEGDSPRGGVRAGEAVGFRYTNREVKELGGSERQMKDLDGVEVSGRSGAVTRG